MSLNPCPQCGHMVSAEAAACPSCGHPLAVAKKEKETKIAVAKKEKDAKIGCGVIILCIIMFIGYAITAGGKLQEEEKANPTCVSDYKKCKDNKEIIDRHKSKNNFSLEAECKIEAQKIAKYGEPNLPFLAFKTYFKGNFYIDDGTAVLIEDGATYKNAFGADVHVRARCEYDLKNDTTLVSLTEK